DKVIEVARFEFINHVAAEINARYPAILNVLKPLFIIAVVRSVEIKHILTNHDKFVNSRIDHQVDHFPFEQHDIVVYRIIPFADQLDNGITSLVIGKQNFKVQCVGAKIIPLGMKQEVVYLFVKFKFTVLRSVKRRQLIFG